MSAAVDKEDERMRLAHERMQSGKRKRAAPPAYTKHQHDGSDADAVVVAVLPRSRVLLAVSEVTRPAADLLCSPVSGAAFCLPMAPNTSNRLAFNAIGHLGPHESPFRTLGSAELDPVPHGLTVAQPRRDGLVPRVRASDVVTGMGCGVCTCRVRESCRVLRLGERARAPQRRRPAVHKRTRHSKLSTRTPCLVAPAR